MGYSYSVVVQRVLCGSDGFETTVRLQLPKVNIACRCWCRPRLGKSNWKMCLEHHVTFCSFNIDLDIIDLRIDDLHSRVGAEIVAQVLKGDRVTFNTDNFLSTMVEIKCRGLATTCTNIEHGSFNRQVGSMPHPKLKFERRSIVVRHFQMFEIGHLAHWSSQLSHRLNLKGVAILGFLGREFVRRE